MKEMREVDGRLMGLHGNFTLEIQP